MDQKVWVVQIVIHGTVNTSVLTGTANSEEINGSEKYDYIEVLEDKSKKKNYYFMRSVFTEEPSKEQIKQAVKDFCEEELSVLNSEINCAKTLRREVKRALRRIEEDE